MAKTAKQNPATARCFIFMAYPIGLDGRRKDRSAFRRDAGNGQRQICQNNFPPRPRLHFLQLETEQRPLRVNQIEKINLPRQITGPGDFSDCRALGMSLSCNSARLRVTSRKS